MEEEHTHQLHLADRRSGQITGVVDVQAFDENEIRLETQQGMLQIQARIFMWEDCSWTGERLIFRER